VFIFQNSLATHKEHPGVISGQDEQAGEDRTRGAQERQKEAVDRSACSKICSYNHAMQ